MKLRLIDKIIATEEHTRKEKELAERLQENIRSKKNQEMEL